MELKIYYRWVDCQVYQQNTDMASIREASTIGEAEWEGI